MTSPPADLSLPPPLLAACEHLAAAWPGVLAGCATALARAASTSPPGYRHRRLLDARALVQGQASQAEQPFRAELIAHTRKTWLRRASLGDRAPTGWAELTLVDAGETDRQVAGERLGMGIGAGCEWEWRGLEGALRSLAGAERLSVQRLPLGPDAIGHALQATLSTWPIEADLRPAIENELVGAWSAALPALYVELVTRFESAGHRAMAPTPAPGHPEAPERARAAERGQGGARPPATARDAGSGGGATRVEAWRAGTRERPHAGPSADPQAATAGSGAPLTDLLRRLSSATAQHPTIDLMRRSAQTAAPADGEAGSALPNLILQHDVQLRAHARHALDHRIIDAVGALFEHILADPKVPAAMAQQIARLQLPVLRAALADPRFFSSTGHPVRRTLNRLASLGSALDGLPPEAAQALMDRVRQAVQSIVDGDFAQLAVFAQTLDELEVFVAEQGRADLVRHGADAELLARHEQAEQRAARFSEHLASAWSGVGLPDFLRRFTLGAWSRVIARTAARLGVLDAQTQSALMLSHELVMSIHPRSDARQHREFIARLPKLMQQLSAGMDLIDWPVAERRAFFDQLLPCHARSLRGEGLSTLDQNLLSRQLEQGLREALARAWASGTAALEPGVSAASDDMAPLGAGDAQALGLLDENQVAWSAPEPQEPITEPVLNPSELALQGLPQPDGVEPNSGPELIQHLAVGCAYRMRLPDGWHKVRLTHVSPGQAFYVFTRGQRHSQLISLTQRMLLRLCEARRLRSFEHATLVERATLRARAQLAALRSAPAL